MFAIVEIGGQQFKVSKGDKFTVKRLIESEGKKVIFEKVYLVNDGKNIEIGTPFVDGTIVEAKIIAHKKGEKIHVFKMKSKKRYAKRKGHRDFLTEIQIEDIKKGKPAVKPVVKEASKPEVKVKKETKTVIKSVAKSVAVTKPAVKKTAKKTVKKQKSEKG